MVFFFGDSDNLTTDNPRVLITTSRLAVTEIVTLSEWHHFNPVIMYLVVFSSRHGVQYFLVLHSPYCTLPYCACSLANGCIVTSIVHETVRAGKSNGIYQAIQKLAKGTLLL